MRQLQRTPTNRFGMSPSKFSGAVTLLRYAIRIQTGTLAVLKEVLRRSSESILVKFRGTTLGDHNFFLPDPSQVVIYEPF